MRRVSFGGVSAGLALHLVFQFGAIAATGASAAAASALVALSVDPGVFSARALVQKQLSATGLFSDGSQTDLTGKLKWSSSDSAVASVGNGTTKGGLVETLGIGSAQITASDGAGHSASALIVVTAELVALEITPASITLRGGTGRSLGARGTFSDGAIVPLRKVVQWASSDDGIATVSNAAGKVGLVVAGNELGTATITATVAGATPAASTASAQVTVNAQLVAFDLLPRSLKLRVKKTKQLIAQASFSNGTLGVDITRFVDFTSSNPAVAAARNRPRKNGEGVGAVTGVAPGTAQVTAVSPTTGVAGQNAVAVRVR